MPTTRIRRRRLHKVTVVRSGFNDAAWRAAHRTRGYAAPGTTYEDYAPAYRYGVLVADKHGHKTFAEVEPVLAAEWLTVRGPSRLDWDKARPAVEEAYTGLVRVQPVRTVRTERSAKSRTTRRKSRSTVSSTHRRTTRTRDDRTKRGPQDRARINVHEPWEVRYWCDRLGVSAPELRRAVKAAGPLAKDVRRQLRKK
jgi:Protein of unknown function (DUF3606)